MKLPRLSSIASPIASTNLPNQGSVGQGGIEPCMFWYFKSTVLFNVTSQTETRSMV